jgi:peroxiredoxin
MMSEFPLPADLPVPLDDGRADHLPGLAMPALVLLGTDGQTVALNELGPGRTIIYMYPMTGRPGVDLPDGWDAIPGARGCTPESCGFRDLHGELLQAGAARLYGMSSQDTDYQREAAARLNLPFPLLADADLAVATALRLPTFEVDGNRLYSRLTLVVSNAIIEHVFYPIFPPDAHAGEVLSWLKSAPS